MTRNEGYFPPGSVLRRVHRERAVGLLYGQRALGIGALAPLNFVGTRNHTRALDKPFRRLSHTGKAFETIFFGSRAEADRVLAYVERMHGPVKGELAEDAGPVPAGTSYSAFDPDLMLWTIAVMADSAEYFHRLFVRPLGRDELDLFWREYVRFGELFGMPADVAPDTWDDFRAWLRGRVEGPGAFLTEEARVLGSAIMFDIPVPATRWPAMRLHNLIMLGSLPPRVREIYGLRWTPAHAAAQRAALAGLRATRPITPAVVRHGKNTRSFDLVSGTESARIARGQPVAGALR